MPLSLVPPGLIWTNIGPYAYSWCRAGSRCGMRAAVTKAKAQLTELIRRAEAGEEVVLTRRVAGFSTIVQPAPDPRRIGRDTRAPDSSHSRIPGPFTRSPHPQDRHLFSKLSP
jgi:antitoxin (DNA-binding transcriptional repressor) of toxin-antitoxin stability system